MKKLFRLFVATAIVAFAAACGNDSPDPYIPTNGDTDVTFSATMPSGIVGRAEAEVSDGTTATNLDYAIYVTGDLEDKTKPQVILGNTTFVDRKATFTVRLVAGKSYDIIFWATAPDNNVYSVDWTTKVLSIDYTNDVQGNNEKRDAFVWVERGYVVKSDNLSKSVVLKRPFARLNIGLDDVYEAMQAGYQLDATQVKASTHTQFDFSLGTAETPGAPVGPMTEVTFDWAAPVKNPATFTISTGDEYAWASFNYLLAGTPSETTNVEVAFRYKEDQTPEKLPAFTWVPIERNHRTNIVGSLLTDPSTFNVSIDQSFDDQMYDIVAWDGKVDPLPAPNAEGNIVIEKPGQFAALLQGADKPKQPVKLAADLDMAGYKVAVSDQIQYGLNIDGQGHTVKNIVPAVNATANALFPKTASATVKNLTIEGITVTPAAVRAEFEGDFYAGALFGATYGNVVVENVTVKGAVIAGVNKVGGLVGFVAEKSLTVINCSVEGCEVSTISEADGGCVGGLIGYVTPSAKVVASSVKNTKIVAINAVGEAKRANSEFIGAYHGSKGTTLEIEKAVVEGNTYTETANGYVAPDYYKGLLGGMRNADGVVVIDGVQVGEVKPEIVNVSVKAIEFAAEGGEQVVAVEVVGNAELVATTDVEWAKATVEGTTITVKAVANEVTELQEGNLTITYGESQQVVPMTIAPKVIVPEIVSVSVETIEVAAEGGSATVEVEVVGEAVLEVTCPEWVSAEVAENVVTVVVAANEAEEELVGEIVLAYGESTKTIVVKQAAKQVAKVVKATVAEFLAAEEDETIYELTGTVKNVANATYGNFDLVDATGTVLIYGVVDAAGTTKIWSSLGVVEGDIITVQGARASYNGAAQMKNGVYISHTEGAPAITAVNPTSLSFGAEGASKQVTVTVYGKGEVTASANAEWLSTSVAGNVVTVTAAANEGDARKAEVTIAFAGTTAVVAVSQDAKSSDDGGAAEPVTATLTFNNVSKRTTFTTSQQVWEENGVVVTNNKGKSTSNVADYSNPARFYKSSELIVDAPGKITQIVFDANNASYATALKGSITAADGGTVSISSDKVTVDFAEAVDSYTIASLTGGQVRMDAVTVTYLK